MNDVGNPTLRQETESPISVSSLSVPIVPTTVRGQGGTLPLQLPNGLLTALRQPNVTSNWRYVSFGIAMF